MKIAVSSQGKDLQSPLDPRFGRARYFILLDTETGAFSVLDNRVNLEAAQGAGIQAAKKIIDSGAVALVTGHVGPKAFDDLKAGAVKIYTAGSGNVGDLIEQCQAGLLEQAFAAGVAGHW